MGGVWSDAEGSPPASWPQRDDQRCQDLVISVYGRFDQNHYQQLRAGETQAVGDLLARIGATEPPGQRARTVTVFRDVAAATHETMLARRAADRVKIDYDAESPEAKLSDDQKTAAKVLGQHGALDTLLNAAPTGDADRRLFGLLLALDRMETARGLPKQLKFFAVGAAFAKIFGAAPPAGALRPNAPARMGAWLSYLSSVAARAGYPVTAPVSATAKARETLAWTGVGQGFARQLDVPLKNLPPAAVPELSRVGAAFIARVQTEREMAEHVAVAPAPAEEELIA